MEKLRSAIGDPSGSNRRYSCRDRACPPLLRQAIASSARFIPGYQAYEQGNGLFRVEGAWNLLQAGVGVYNISSKVPVRTPMSQFLATPHVGVGIHDREGVKAGDNYSRDYTFVRNAGPNGSVTYQVSWVGNNNGTFSSPATVTLPKGGAVKFRVQINPRSAGMHSAILNLDNAVTTGVEYQTLNTVVAAEDFTAQNSFSIRHGGTIGRNQATSFFVRVPPSTPVLKVDLQGGGTAPGAGQIRFLRYHPRGVPFESTNSVACYNPPVAPDGSCASGSPTSRTIARPTPGVWEIVVDARRTSDVAFAPYTLTASVLGPKITPNPDVIQSATIGQPINRQYQVQNVRAGFTGRTVGTTLGSAFLTTRTMGDERLRFEFQVTPGTTKVHAKIGGTSDPDADLDLFVFNCTSGTCEQVGLDVSTDSEEEVTILNPAPGRWAVDVNAFAVPAGTTSFNYLDVFTNPAFGTLAVTDANALRPAGAQWTVQGVLTPNAKPAAGRVLYGNVEVRTDANLLIHAGDVIVQNLS